MKNMYFLNNSIADEYFERNSVKICSDVYRFEGDKVVKRFDLEKSRGIYDDFSVRKILQFKDLDITCFSFTKALVYSGFFEVYATISEYAKGDNIFEKPLSSYSIESVINAIRELETSIKKLSDLGIYVNDVHEGNIVFDGKNMTAIDTLEYYYEEEDSTYIYEENMKKVIRTIFDSVFYVFYRNRFADIYSLHKYFCIRGSEFENFKNNEYLMSPVETLMGIKRLIEEDFGVKLNTFGDCFLYIDKVIKNDFNNKVRVIRK